MTDVLVFLATAGLAYWALGLAGRYSVKRSPWTAPGWSKMLKLYGRPRMAMETALRERLKARAVAMADEIVRRARAR